MNVKELAKKYEEATIAFRRDLHMHPEASLHEFRTTDKVAAELDALGVSYRRLDPTGIIAEIHGKGPGKTVALRGDMDALSIQEKTDFPFKSVNDGMMHACGHDTHTSMLLGAVKVLNEMKDEFNGTVRFVFQPAEEIGKGAELVIAQGGLEGVDRMFGIHCAVQTPVGVIAGVHGAAMASTDYYKVTIKGVTCHGAYPHKGVDATVCGASMVMNLQTMVSREFSPMDPLVVTVGSFHSGSRFNICSGEAVLEGTIRSFSNEVHDQIPAVLKRIVEESAKAFRCEGILEYEAITDVMVNDEEMLQLGLGAARKVTDPELVQIQQPSMGGEDFAAYTRLVPCAFYRVGVGGRHPGHSDLFEVDESAFKTGIAFYAQMALDALAAD